MRATIVVERGGRVVEVDVWGTVETGSPGRWGGGPDGWEQPDPAWAEVERSSIPLTPLELEVAASALVDAAHEAAADDRDRLAEDEDWRASRAEGGAR